MQSEECKELMLCYALPIVKKTRQATLEEEDEEDDDNEDEDDDDEDDGEEGDETGSVVFYLDEPGRLGTVLREKDAIECRPRFARYTPPVSKFFLDVPINIVLLFVSLVWKIVDSTTAYLGRLMQIFPSPSECETCERSHPRCCRLTNGAYCDVSVPIGRWLVAGRDKIFPKSSRKEAKSSRAGSRPPSRRRLASLVRWDRSGKQKSKDLETTSVEASPLAERKRVGRPTNARTKITSDDESGTSTHKESTSDMGTSTIRDRTGGRPTSRRKSIRDPRVHKHRKKHRKRYKYDAVKSVSSSRTSILRNSSSFEGPTGKFKKKIEM